MTGTPQPISAPLVKLTEEGIRDAFKRTGANPYGPAAQDMIQRSGVETAEKKLIAENDALRKQLQEQAAARANPLLTNMSKRKV